MVCMGNYKEGMANNKKRRTGCIVLSGMYIQGRIKQAGGSWDVPVTGNWYADKFIKYT